MQGSETECYCGCDRKPAYIVSGSYKEKVYEGYSCEPKTFTLYEWSRENGYPFKAKALNGWLDLELLGQ
jgi:hypothetical protein